LTVFAVSLAAPCAEAQQSVTEVLSFLLTNRSIPTGDFTQDELAAASTRDTFADFLLAELGTLPISSSAGGFTYRLDRALGTVVLSSDSFGPFFTERSLTSGQGQWSIGLSYQRATFDTIDGRSLRDGTLVAIAGKLRTEPQPFDVETLSLRLDANTVILQSNFGVTDRFDLSAALPFVRLSLNGERVDTYRGQQFTQAIASASASGIGDLVVRGKYNVVRNGGSGVAVGGEIRLPTGDEENLLGAGEASVKPSFVGSFERDRFGLHGNIGYSFLGLSRALDYGTAVTVVGVPQLTLIGEIIGRRHASFAQLTEVVSSHPRLAGVDTIRLSSVDEASDRVFAVMGFKWNVSGTWLVSANLLRPLSSAGLNASWVPTLTFDYSFGQ
jgi:hypothetical protein